MSIFSLAEQPTSLASKMIAALQQQSMIAEVEALLGKFAKPAAEPLWPSMGHGPIDPEPVIEAPAPKRRGRKPKAAGEAPKLNAVGKPFSPQYDPKYRMQYKTPKWAPKAGSSTAAHIANLDNMRAHIAQHWS